MIKNIVALMTALLISTITFSSEIVGQYNVRVLKGPCSFGNICHKSDYTQETVFLERRKIKFENYSYNDNNVYAMFRDIETNRQITQKACPVIIEKIGMSFYVTYDPYKHHYSISCKNIK